MNTEQPNTSKSNLAEGGNTAPCGEKAVEFPAAFTAHTPSGPTFACTDHASKIVAVMLCMGAHVNLTPAPDGAQCSNCVNEAKRSGAAS